jgi:hypothetical protein
MRTRLMCVQLVALAALALLVSAAAAAPGHWAGPAKGTPAARPVPAWVIAP